MADLALDTTTNDLLIEDDSLSIIDGDDAILQHLAIRMRFFLGEWFLDQRIGIPYFEDILVKAPNLITVRSVFTDAILSTPGVESLNSFNLSVDAAIRKLSLSFTAVKDDSTTLDFSREFILP